MAEFPSGCDLQNLVYIWVKATGRAQHRDKLSINSARDGMKEREREEDGEKQKEREKACCYRKKNIN